MHDVKEDLLQFIWQHKCGGKEFTGENGEKIKVLRTGELNRHAGPDFFNAQIEADGLFLCGNVEIHVKTSDWLRHKHQQNEAYDHLILHVVYIHDAVIEQNHIHSVSVLELKNHISDSFIQHYSALLSSGSAVPCSNFIAETNSFILDQWLTRMMIERLEQKYNYTLELYRSFNGDFRQTFFTLTLRSFGFKVNGFPFEVLARMLPYKLLFNHKDSLFQLEALLLGSSGFLDETFSEEYPRALQKEFEYLKNKYRINPLKKEIFKFSRLRPANFPTLRLAQFSALFNQQPFFFCDPLSIKQHSVAVNALLHFRESEFWRDRYSFFSGAKKNSIGLGKSSAENIVMNALVHFHFFYGKKFGEEKHMDTAIEWMEKTTTEKNSRTGLFPHFKQRKGGAGQALMHLYDHYCSARKCLECAIGASVIKKYGSLEAAPIRQMNSKR